MLAPLLLAAALAASPAPAGAAAPAATAPRAPLDPVATLREAERRLRQAVDAGATPEALGALAAGYVDYEALARRSLGKAWRAQPPRDRAALVAALRALLEETWLRRLAPGAGGTLEARLVRRRGGVASVHLELASGGRTAGADLALLLGKDGRWRVADAVVGGLALAEGYQEQFPQLLALGGMPRLLGQLEAERQALAARRPGAAPRAPAAAQAGGP